MIIKNIGYLLLFRLKLFALLAKLSPLLIFASLYLFVVILDMKDKYKFQEPSLRTKAYDLSQQTSLKTNYIVLSQNIREYFINGLISHESIVICLKESIHEQFEKQIINTLEKDNNLSKNIIFLRYQGDIEHFEKLIKDIPGHWGIVRVALNLDIIANATKVVLNRYGKQGICVDQDYFLSIKQLLQSNYVKWQSCPSNIYPPEILRFLRFHLSRLFVDQLLCQIQNTINTENTVNNIWLSNSVQSATLKTQYRKYKNAQIIAEQKLKKIILSFIKQFSLQEDHLHSSSTLFYPVDNYGYINVFRYMLPSLGLMVGVIIWILNSQWRQTQAFKINQLDICIVLILSVQFYLRKSFNWSLYLFPLRLIYGSYGKNPIKKVLIGIEVLLGFYFGIFNLSLSIICMMLTLIMIIVPQFAIIFLLVIYYYKYWAITFYGSSSIIILPFLLFSTMRIQKFNRILKIL